LILIRRLEWLTVASALAFIIAVALDAAGQFLARLGWLVLGLVLIGFLLAGLVLASRKWSVERWRVLVLPVLAGGGLASWPAAAQAGVWYRDREFLRTLPAYERVVERFRSGTLPPGDLLLDSLPSELRECCYRVVALRDSTGHLLVEFWVGRLLYHHSAWMYYAGPSGKAAGRAREWPMGYEVAPHWYRVAD
jgi:hypothetical protein